MIILSQTDTAMLMRQTLQAYCEQFGRAEILEQWNTVRNGDLTPMDVTFGSHKRVWWRCPKGHEWQAIVKSRIERNDCPLCANKVTVPGVNDLGTTHPLLAAQWHPEKNGELTPQMVVSGTSRKVWWRCEMGHSWQATIASRAKGSDCPVCAGKVVVAGENDLASQFPQIAAQWDMEANGGLLPSEVTHYSNKRIWWRCGLGHTWKTTVASRTSAGSNCPYCGGKKVLAGFNDLASRDPEMAAQWHPTLNGSLRPDMVTAGSSKKVWWQCVQGHAWHAVIQSRTKHRYGCPVCAGKVKLARQMRYREMEAEKNIRSREEPVFE